MTEMNKAAAGPLVSVVTPVYNMEPFLGEMLDSVLASDYPQLEVDHGGGHGLHPASAGVSPV